MYIWFEGIGGTCACRGVRGEAPCPDGDDDCLEGEANRSSDLLGEAFGRKGCEARRGDTDSAETEADGCALYVRRVWKDGMLMACW